MNIINEIINDCLLLKHIYNGDNIEFVILHITNKNLIIQFYEEKLNFTNKELLLIYEDFIHLSCSRINELLIIMKYYKFKPNIENKFYINQYNNIKLQENLFMTFVYYNYEKPLKILYKQYFKEYLDFSQYVEVNNTDSTTIYLYSEINNFLKTQFNFDCNNAMLLAIKNNNLNIVKFLSEIGVSLKNKEYLRIISVCGYINLLIYFKSLNINLNDYNNLSLKCACENGQFEIVRFFFDNNIYYNDINNLKNAIFFGHYELVKLLLNNSDKIDIELLTIASENGHYEIVLLILEYKIFNIKDETINKVIENSFIFSCKNGYYKIAKLLFERFSEIKENILLIVIINASENGNIFILKLILEISKNILNNKDDYILNIACKNGHYEIVKILIENNFNIYNNNEYPLRISSENGHFKIVEFLLLNGADLHSYNDYSLIISAKNGYYNIVNLLIQYNANVNANNSKALTFALENNNLNIVDLLLKNKAEILFF